MSYSVFPAPVIESKGPVDIEWTNVGYQSGSGVATVTFSSISGYKMLKLVATGLPAGAGNLNVTFNGDTAGNYSWQGLRTRDISNPFSPMRFHANTAFQFGYSDSGSYEGHLIIEDATSTTAHKQFSATYAGFEGAPAVWDVKGVYRSNSAITSISIARGSGGVWGTLSSPIGFYLYGAN